MAYLALARKWRPRNFDEVVGQEHVIKALKHALQFDRTHHAYLFAGTRGVGKTTIARILAKALNCQARDGYNPCGSCATCQELDGGRFVDLIEVDAASRTKVEDTRDLLENVQYAPSYGRYKVYLIDEVHMLSAHSFNALLKTLEEPPPHVQFLLATTDPQRIPVTVLSRCLQFNLKHLSAEQIRSQLEHIAQQEHIAHDASALRALSRAAAGSMRDALSLMDQAIVHGGGSLREAELSSMLGTVAREPVFGLLTAIAAQDAVAVLQLTAEIAQYTPDFTDVLQHLLAILHHAALAQWAPDILKRDEDADRIKALAEQLSAEDLQLFYQIALIGQRDLPLATDPQSGFEMVLLRMLAFRPTVSSVRTPSQSAAPVRTPGASASPRARHEPPVAHANPVVVDSVRPVPAVAASPASPLRAAPGSPNSEWAGLIEATGLGGMARELASHCLLRTLTPEACHLILGRPQAHLRTPQVESTIEAALRKHLATPVKLTISVEGEVDDTPAIQQQRAREERQRRAELTIEQDDNVKAFKELFDAEIVSGSIRPLD
ncbi:DNA polymerase III subunit gamma/tau [Methylolobus aquaticus]|nr:DNA polymerase III subunit gamma/tau [Methylolobus aquaticus]